MMTIHGLTKLTLLDFPEHIACTVFTGHCNLRCPFCHNAPLVLFPDTQPTIPEDILFAFLKKRAKTLEGVCVTGGEPTLAEDLPAFLKKIRSLGYLVKLDTNGTNPALLRQVMEGGLVDYVAMDIKSSLPRYPEAVGIPGFVTDTVQESAAFLMRAGIPYEFRTTAMRELHDAATFSGIGRWLHGARAYYLQAFRADGDLVGRHLQPSKAFTAYPAAEMKEFLALLAPHFDTVGLRGVS